MLILLLVASTFQKPLLAQWNADLHSTITTQHYWRGLMINNSANYEGDLTISNGNLSLGAWGGYAFNGNYSEFDIHMSYLISEKLQLSIWDLYASRDRASIDDYKYFDFDRTTTNHLIDASLLYRVSNQLPGSLYWRTLVWGRDLDEEQNQNYSSYLELRYGFNIDQLKFKAYVGVNVFENSMYAANTNVVNLGLFATKELKITEHLTLPIWFQLAMNPEKETSNMIVGIEF
jgi:hypothetical protein